MAFEINSNKILINDLTSEEILNTISNKLEFLDDVELQLDLLKQLISYYSGIDIFEDQNLLVCKKKVDSKGLIYSTSEVQNDFNDILDRKLAISSITGYLIGWREALKDPKVSILKHSWLKFDITEVLSKNGILIKDGRKYRFRDGIKDEIGITSLNYILCEVNAFRGNPGPEAKLEFYSSFLKFSHNTSWKKWVQEKRGEGIKNNCLDFYQEIKRLLIHFFPYFPKNGEN
ncbi:hypothetical protein QNI16_23595 [Cytophagaceae bacterium YF14B1]|uniref:Uncharacterized protein n=1 Tax=Xanthocytophaga flava TaxID=3048013 RepID=A0AAE3QVU2_9BACT|nr:hypothetical protein [Xanthocytophaga flavus]MDJ1483503.1 hypothetical protein [Xanthocytophaga flavus]